LDRLFFVSEVPYLSLVSIIKATYQINKPHIGLRLNEFAEQYLSEFTSRKGVKKGIKRGEILLNNEQVEGGRRLVDGDTVTIVELAYKPPKTYALKFPVIYEDDYLAVINKPAGLTVSGNKFKTVLNALGYNLTQSNDPDALPWPQPVHRLDNQTSGLLLIAKTKKTRIALGQAFEEKKITKKYAALLIGHLAKQKKIEEPIDGKPSVSIITPKRWAKSLKNETLTLAELLPLTGRTHQLRIHSAKAGFPILGDKLYGKEGSILKNKGLFLSAIALTFVHPVTTQKIDLKIEPPTKFVTRLANEERRYLNYDHE
jgi:23S rRNA pseudouridine1911/1915/1917 synthase